MGAAILTYDMATTDGESKPYKEYGDPTGFGLNGTPEFNTTQVVDWRCPHCGEDGFHRSGLRDSFVLCTNMDCPVEAFCCFRGEEDSE